MMSRELSPVMKSVIAILEAEGFTANVEQSYMYMHKKIGGTGVADTLSVTLDDHNRSETNQHTNVEFNGLGVKSSRSMTYYTEGVAKLASRIKRVMRNAQAAADRDHRAQEARLEKFTKINNEMCDRGFTGSFKCDWTGNAIFISNGYSLTVSNELTTPVSISGERVVVDIEVAIAMAVLAPTKYKEEE